MQPIKPLLQIQLTFKNLFIFQLFFFCMHELHELAHIIIGRIMCHEWGTRDFNVWDLCKTCDATYPQIATFAGPVFTFIMLWLGRYLINHGDSIEAISLGLVFVFGNMPFGRMYMALMGSGDEVYGLRSLLLNPQHSNLIFIRLLGFAIVTIFCLPPLVTAWKFVANKRKTLVFAGLLIVPLILDTLILLIGLNNLLTKGILSEVYLLGTPILIQIWFVACAISVVTGYKCLTRFAKQANGFL